MGDEIKTVCMKCQKSPPGLMRCKECLVFFCGRCYPPLIVDSGVIADKTNFCPKCDSRKVEDLT